GEKTSQRGQFRRFVTPALEQGQNYTYEIRAVWDDNGNKVERTRKVQVRAGQQSSVDFMAMGGGRDYDRTGTYDRNRYDRGDVDRDRVRDRTDMNRNDYDRSRDLNRDRTDMNRTDADRNRDLNRDRTYMNRNRTEPAPVPEPKDQNKPPTF